MKVGAGGQKSFSLIEPSFSNYMYMCYLLIIEAKYLVVAFCTVVLLSCHYYLKFDTYLSFKYCKFQYLAL